MRPRRGRLRHEDPLIACGIDAQCPPGQACCALRGVCFDPARPASCAASPDGPWCADDTDCQRLDGTWWPLLTSGTSDTYQNECEAASARIRVAHDGAC